ncbi:hypothetical protein AbraIFM66950_001371, partial [Aspergillus brasiliensis]
VVPRALSTLTTSLVPRLRTATRAPTTAPNSGTPSTTSPTRTTPMSLGTLMIITSRSTCPPTGLTSSVPATLTVTASLISRLAPSLSRLCGWVTLGVRVLFLIARSASSSSRAGLLPCLSG